MLSEDRNVNMDPAPALVGRDAEMATADMALTDAVRNTRITGTVFVGTAGAGKTTLLQATVVSARDRGFKVLASSAGAQEVSLGYAVLADLLRGVAPERIETLPLPQRRALRAILLVEEPDAAVTGRAAAAGLLAVLTSMAAEAPVALALDDLQWMDRSSRRALEFALRRLHGVPLAIVATLRATGEMELPLGLDALREAAIQKVTPKPLSVAAIHHILKASLGATFSRPTLIRITTLAEGNPLLASEIARSIIDAGGVLAAGAPAPLQGATIRRLLGRRLASLAPEQRRTLLVAALSERGSLEQIRQAHRPLGWRVSLPPRSAGLLEISDDSVAFVHPLYPEAVMAGAARIDLAAVHSVLGEISSRADVRARHLARASADPDERIASALDAAAERARATAAIDEAVEFAELAVKRSPEGSPCLLERMVRHADLLFRSGDANASATVLDTCLRASRSSADELAVLIRLARVSAECRPPQAIIEVCERAIRSADTNSIAVAEAHLVWADVAGSPSDALRHVRTALRHLSTTAPDALRARALGLAAIATSHLGRAVDMASVEAAVALEGADPPERTADSARFARAFLLLMADDLDRSRQELETLLLRAAATGDESSTPLLLANLAHLEIRAGRWPRARELSARLLQDVERADQPWWASVAHVQLGNIAALLGEGAVAEQHLGTAFAAATDLDYAFAVSISLAARGMLALADERPHDAYAFLSESRRHMGSRVLDPGMTPWQAVEVEAAVRAGQLTAARDVADLLERRARRARRKRVVAMVDRGRALMASADGDLDLALRFAQKSTRALAALPVPFEHARSLLVLGSIHRRRREKRIADEVIGRARDMFEALGAARWLRQADAERSRIGLRPRAPATLTSTEELVARLAAEGRSNREVATEAFISRKTVEANLARVYHKLGIRSRAELGRRMAEREQLAESPEGRSTTD